MPSGPYPTAFGEPHALPPPPPPPPQATTTTSSRSMPETTPRPPSHPHDLNLIRPSSPAPSYHTLPPDTHTSLSNNNNHHHQYHSTASANPLLATARATPDALLSTLTLTNHTTSLPKHHFTGDTGGQARHLAARTSDGKERYRVTSLEGAVESVVWRRDAAGPRTVVVGEEGKGEVVGRLIGGSQGLRVLLGGGGSGGVGGRGGRGRGGGSDVGRNANRTLVSLQYESVQKSRRLELDGFMVDGRDVGLRWEVVTLAESLSAAPSASVSTGAPPPPGPAAAAAAAAAAATTRGTQRRASGSRKSMDTHDRKRSHAAISSLRLVDRYGDVYAQYTHDVGLPDLHRDGEVWGEVRLRARAVLIDGAGGGDGSLAEKMDRAFLTLVVLLEAFVRVLGGNKRGERNWGNLAGGMGCEVM